MLTFCCKNKVFKKEFTTSPILPILILFFLGGNVILKDVFRSVQNLYTSFNSKVMAKDLSSQCFHSCDLFSVNLQSAAVKIQLLTVKVYFLYKVVTLNIKRYHDTYLNVKNVETNNLLHTYQKTTDFISFIICLVIKPSELIVSWKRLANYSNI